MNIGRSDDVVGSFSRVNLVALNDQGPPFESHSCPQELRPLRSDTSEPGLAVQQDQFKAK
jgi:hypothetical protein